MKVFQFIRNAHAGTAWLVVCLLLSSATTFAQEKDQQESAEKGVPKADEKPVEPEAKEQDAAQEEDKNRVAVNLNNVEIDKVTKFLSELTGKTVMKHKDAKAKITLVSHEKVDKQKAVRMICDALRLDKIAVVERNDTIWLIPESILPQMDIGLTLGTEELPEIGVISKAIPVKFVDIANLEKLIRPLLSEKATLIAHPGAKKIIVTDTVERIASLERIMAELDVLDVDDRKVQIFELKHADAEELAPIIKSIMASPGDKNSGGQSPEDGGQSAGSASMIEIQPYKIANWLLVVAPKDKISQIATLIEELDKELQQELKMWVIPIEYADAVTIGNELTQLLKQRPEKRFRDAVEITANSRANSLVVLASDLNYRIILEVIKELDTEESVEMKTQWYSLKHADAEDLADQMNELYSGMEEDNDSWYYWYRRRDEQKSKTRFVAERRSNSLIAIAPPNEYEKIEDMIDKLDQPIDLDEVTPRIYAITHSDAKELADVLNRVFGVKDKTKGGGYYDYMMERYSDRPEVGRLYGKVRFDPLQSINSIIVTTNNKENFPIIETFIQDIDRHAPEAANLLVIRLKNARAEDVARQLNILFAPEGARVPDKKAKEDEEQRRDPYAFLYGKDKKKDERPISNLIGRVRVVEDVRSNSIIITTAPQNHEALRQLVAGLDMLSPKVYVSVRLIAVIRSEVERIGIRYSSDPSVFETEDFDNGIVSAFGLMWEDVYNNGVLNADLNVSALIQFMSRSFNLRILSDTGIMMDNNKEGTIFVGAEIPFITQSQTSPEGGSLTSTFEYRDAGTTLRLTPNINDDDNVVMDISLISSQIREGEIILGGQVLDSRTIDTMLAVEDGQTIVIGGIMTEQELKSNRGVPILRHIPILNLAFGKKDKDFEVVEFVTFITPKVLRSRADDEALTLETADRLRERGDIEALPEHLQIMQDKETVILSE